MLHTIIIAALLLMVAYNGFGFLVCLIELLRGSPGPIPEDYGKSPLFTIQSFIIFALGLWLLFR